jgi:hypothetical protein
VSYGGVLVPPVTPDGAIDDGASDVCHGREVYAVMVRLADERIGEGPQFCGDRQGLCWIVVVAR